MGLEGMSRLPLMWLLLLLRRQGHVPHRGWWCIGRRIWGRHWRWTLEHFLMSIFMMDLKSRRISLRVHANTTLSSSITDRNWARRLVALERMWLTVLRDRWPIPAPLRFCRFNRFVKVRASAWLIRLSKVRTRSRMVEMLDARESEKDEDSDCPSWGDNDDNWDGKGIGDGGNKPGQFSVCVPRERVKRSKGLWPLRLSTSEELTSFSGYCSTSKETCELWLGVNGSVGVSRKERGKSGIENSWTIRGSSCCESTLRRGFDSEWSFEGSRRCSERGVCGAPTAVSLNIWLVNE